ncbi:DnaJ domain-containing protein [Hysterangium stoloniferum]|nr:DnaJ domain-containing protein [Hysterangium stoloniferum]
MFPDYYDLLSISPTATQEEIRQAYRRESLRTHPDRLPDATPEQKRRATEKFQAVADAYYVLSDPTRRKEYDLLYASRTKKDTSAEPEASSNFFSNFASFFSTAAPPPQFGAQRPDAEGVFADVFEEMLRPEVTRQVPWWTYVGAASGGALGYIIGNFPGMLFGGYAGNRLGAIRDAKGKSVAMVFAQLEGSQKAEILKALAMKVLGSAFTA